MHLSKKSLGIAVGSMAVRSYKEAGWAGGSSEAKVANTEEIGHTAQSSFVKLACQLDTASRAKAVFRHDS